MLRKLLMENICCSECGGHWWTMKIGSWTPDGLIVSHLGNIDSPPMIIIEVEQQRNVFRSLREALDLDIDRFIMEAERKNIMVWVTSLLKRYPRFLIDNFLVKRLLCRVLTLIGNRLPGYGWIKVVSLNPGTHLLYRFRDPYYLPMAVGAVQGLYEAVFGGASVANWAELVGGEYMVTIVRVQRPSDLEDCLEYMPRKVAPGLYEYKRCPKCGLPLKAMYHTKYWDSGIVYNNITGLREILSPNSGGENIFSELICQFGEEIPRLLIEAEREFMSNRLKEYGLRLSFSGHSGLKEDNAENLQILLDDLPFRGMGNPVDLSFEDGVLKVRVENPFNEARICGMVLGWYEALENRKGHMEWKVPEGEWAVEMKISPA